MRKTMRRLVFLALAVGTFLLGGLLADSARLRQEMLRLHVVAASDSETDQQIKLRVRDAVLASLGEGLRDLSDPQAAFSYVERMLPKLEQAAEAVLQEAGVSDRVSVRLTEEAFPVREYDTFSLPSGIYHSLRVIIGEGEGHNWWCVVFPQLCTGTDPKGFREAADRAELPDSLQRTLTGEYEIRFWLLDQLGRLGNLWAETFS